jgi:predicted DsbA family dithiol-disulfide isomerase
LDTFTLTWRAFYLNPRSPTFPGINKEEMYAEKFGVERSKAMFARLSAAGEVDGIAFKFGGNTGSTRDSHRVIWYEGEEEAKGTVTAAGTGVGGLQTRVVENLFRAYFEEEKNITDSKVLVEAAVQAGLDGGEVTKLLESGVGAEQVDAEAFTASRRLVSGVPHFTVQGKYLVEGADEPETFLEVFERVKLDE